MKNLILDKNLTRPTAAGTFQEAAPRAVENLKNEMPGPMAHSADVLFTSLIRLAHRLGRVARGRAFIHA